MNTSFSINKSLLITISFLTLASCSKNNDDIYYDLAGNWKVIYFMENNTKISKTDENTWPDINNGDITAVFTEPDSNGKGELSGITVTNHYFGEYTIKKNGQIEIGSVVATLINEPDWTNLYNIGAAENYEIRNSNLVIYYNNKNSSIVFERN